MKVFINGNETFTNAFNILDLLKEIDVAKEKIAVEGDAIVIPKSQFASFAIKENSKIEIITFVGGG